MRPWLRAAGAGRQCAPAARVAPRPARPQLLVLAARRFRDLLAPLLARWVTCAFASPVSQGRAWLLTVVGGGRDAPVLTRRGRRKTVCARGAYWASSRGPSTSPLGAADAPLLHRPRTSHLRDLRFCFRRLSSVLWAACG